MKTRLQAFALAGVLALTTLTGGAAAIGLSHWGSKAPAATPAVAVQTAGFHDWEGGD